MKTVTLDQLMTWRPCLSPQEILALTGGRDRLSLLEICDLETATPYERLWVLLRPEVIGARRCHELACRCAERALTREREAGREPDAALWAAVATKRAWLAGQASDADLLAAESAARAVLRAAESAVHAAANAAWSARSAADAAESAAYDEERLAQLRLIREALLALESEGGGE